ncbi:hypothetical protein LACDD01_01739 [Lactococcus sp. DD01]|nr:hypothetical protein LACDD01_01739 [Lactococcus sp. DD01]
MTERKVIKAKKQAIRRARLKKAGTVAAMLPLVMSKGAPVATLIRGRHDEEVPGIEQVVEMPEQEIADVVLPEMPAEADYEEEKETEVLEELEIQEISETPATFEAPQKFEAPRFSEGGLTQFEASDAYVGLCLWQGIGRLKIHGLMRLFLVCSGLPKLVLGLSFQQLFLTALQL